MVFISKLIQNSKAFFGCIAGLAGLLVYFLGRKDAKNKAKINQLNEQNQSIRKDAKHVVELQRKQAEIASHPSPDRDDVHDWMHHLSKRDKPE